MKFSKKGYLRNSPDVNNSQNIIQGGKITMKGVDFKVHGIDNNGYAKVMTPGYDAIFPNAEHVTETPIKYKNMAPFKLRSGRGNMPKTGRSIPSPFRQEADEVSGEPHMVSVKGSSYRLSDKAKRKAFDEAQRLAAAGQGATFMGTGSGQSPKFRLFKGNKLLDISTGSKSGFDVTGLGGEDTATTGFDPYTLDENAFYQMLESGTVTIMPTGDGTNMLAKSFQQREERPSETRARINQQRREAAEQRRLQKQNGFTQAEDVPVDTTSGINSTPPTAPLSEIEERAQMRDERNRKLEEIKQKRILETKLSREKAKKAVAERNRKLEELKRKRQQR